MSRQVCECFLMLFCLRMIAWAWKRTYGEAVLHINERNWARRLQWVPNGPIPIMTQPSVLLLLCAKVE